MKTVIVGCGRVGAELADAFDQAGHDVIVVDPSTRAFDRLPSTFRGTAVRGDGTDEDTLRRAGAEDADVFLALTEGDNRNVMAAQECDPGHGRSDLGLATLCRTTLMSDAVMGYLGMPVSGTPGIYPPTGVHPGGEHHDLPGPVDGAASASPTPTPAGAPSRTEA